MVLFPAISGIYSRLPFIYDQFCKTPETDTRGPVSNFDVKADSKEPDLLPASFLAEISADQPHFHGTFVIPVPEDSEESEILPEPNPFPGHFFSVGSDVFLTTRQDQALEPQTLLPSFPAEISANQQHSPGKFVFPVAEASLPDHS